MVLHEFAIDIPLQTCYKDDILVSGDHCLVIRSYARTAMLIAGLMDCIHALTCILLFIGIFRRSEVLMLPFLSMTFIQGCRMAIMTVLSVVVFYILKLSLLILVNSSVLHLIAVVYLGVVVYSYYPKIMKSMFRDWYMEMKKNKKPMFIEPHQTPIAWMDLQENEPPRPESPLTLEIKKNEEKAKICKDILCIVIPLVVVGTGWGLKEFILYKYL